MVFVSENHFNAKLDPLNGFIAPLHDVTWKATIKRRILNKERKCDIQILPFNGGTNSILYCQNCKLYKMNCKKF